MDTDGLPTSGAKLCTVAPPTVCFRMPSAIAEGSPNVVYEFGLDPVSERIPLREGGSVVFFLATFSGGGSGTLERAALLRYDSGGKIENLLPYVAVTDQSERQMWRLPEISDYPVLITADFLWNFAAHETHFARHFYTVAAYEFDPRSDRYVETFFYKTSHKYAGLDETDRIRVLGSERDEILRRLKIYAARR